MKLDGFGIMVKDMAVMVRFYRDVLGFAIKEEENTTNVYLEKDGTLFLLYRRSDFEKMTGKTFSYVNGLNGHYEIALSVPDYAAVDAAPLPKLPEQVPKQFFRPSLSPGDSVPVTSPTPKAIWLKLGLL